MTKKEEPARKEIISFDKEQSGSDEEITNIIRRLIEQQRDNVIASQNVISYSHGEGWLAWQHGEQDETREFQEHSHEESIKFQDLIDHKISTLPEYITAMAEGVHAEFMKMIYQTIHESTEQTGNVVNAKQHSSQAEAFLEMLRKIEFGVDRDGAVSRPQIHLSPKMFDKFQNDIDAQDAEFRAKVEELTAEKETAALEREAKRKARFVKPADEE